MYSPFGYGGGMFFSSNYLILVGIPLIIAMWAQFRVSGAFKKWGAVRASSNITGAQAAREILQAANISDVEVVEINDYLGDHYDPTQKRLCLSSNVYNTPSVAALGIAAHETGHAIQHARAYAPLKARMAIVPITAIASRILPFRDFRRNLLSHYWADHDRHLLLSRVARFPIDHSAGGVRRLATRENHPAANGDHPTGRRSRRRK